MNILNTSNPFQIPVCLQRADSQQRRRERFKKGFIAVLAAIVVLLVGLLIEGCMSEKNTGSTSSVTDLRTPRQMATSTARPDSVVQPNFSPIDASTTPAAPAAPVAGERPVAAPRPAVSGGTEAVYVVKPGDNLTHIAKTHGTTVKALKAANNLSNDRIVVGARLKLPSA